MRQLINAGSLLVSLALMVVLAGCNRPSNKTSQKGPGGLPQQQFDSSANVIPWEVPEELKYPNWSQMYDENNRIYIVADDVATVAAWYLEHLPESSKQEVNGTRHVKVKNQTIEVDIESGGEETKIVLNPTDLGTKVDS